MLLHKDDNVSVDSNNGHKYATRLIRNGENVIKYGSVIGYATQDIAEGAHVHIHNMATNLSDDLSYHYKSGPRCFPNSPTLRTFTGYRRGNGTVGIRNDIWIVNTDSCCRSIAEQLAGKTDAVLFSCVLGDDLLIAQKLFRGAVNHPNAGGVLVLGGEAAIENFEKTLSKYDSRRVKFLKCQDVESTLAAGVRLISGLKTYAANFKPEQIPLFHLTVGLKCGDGDLDSDLAENPLAGRFSDKLICRGGSCLLTEVPEMFGAAQLLMERCVSKAVFEKLVAMLGNYKDRCKRLGQPVRETLTPEDVAGGITTPEEKAMRYLQKAGTAPVADVLGYGERVRENGLSIVEGTDKNEDAIINLVASGAHLILFTAGSAAALEAPVPIIRVRAQKEDSGVDFDASCVLQGENPEDALFDYVMHIASGEQTANEYLR
jgi:altronate hydrolase